MMWVMTRVPNLLVPWIISILPCGDRQAALQPGASRLGSLRYCCKKLECARAERKPAPGYCTASSAWRIGSYWAGEALSGLYPGAVTKL